MFFLKFFYVRLYLYLYVRVDLYYKKYGSTSNCSAKNERTKNTGENLLSFINIFLGQFVDFCKGENGSKFVMERLARGTVAERYRP